MTIPTFSYPEAVPALAEVWDMSEAARDDLLRCAIAEAHTYHFERNTSYRATVAARGVGPVAAPEELPRLLRSTSQVFKSYIDVLGTPFPQDRPADFLDWMDEQLSVELHPAKQRLNGDYLSLEAMLKAFERAYSGIGLELLTSTGASGRMALIPRDHKSALLAVQSFHLSFERYLGLKGEHSALVVGTKRSRCAVDRPACAGLQQPGLTREHVVFTSPFPESADQARLRSGLTYRRGWRGVVEKHFSHPLTAAVQTRLLDPRAMEAIVSRLVPAEARNEKVLVFGSLDRVHTIAKFLLTSGRTVALTPDSLLVTIGGAGKAGGAPAAQWRDDLQAVFRIKNGGPAPVRDIYAVPEANWAAVQCSHGNYHIPPWVYAATLDDEDVLQTQPRSAGQLAFFDPLGGGDLFPAFLRTTDEGTLVRGDACPCGAPGCYLEEGSLHDLSGEAGCPGQR